MISSHNPYSRNLQVFCDQTNYVCLNPSNVSILPTYRAIVKYFVVSWKEAAEMNDLVCKDARVIPWRIGVAVAAQHL